MRLIFLLLTVVTVAVPVAAEDFRIEGTKGTELTAARVATFDEPWAMTFLPDGSLLVTEKRGVLWHVSNNGTKTQVQGLWKVAYGGQGGLGDVVLHPDFESNSSGFKSSVSLANLISVPICGVPGFLFAKQRSNTALAKSKAFSVSTNSRTL